MSAANLERTSRRIVAGTWACAVIVMVASAANAALTYGAIGDNRALGLATGVAVDIALCVSLIGDRRLYVHGLISKWGRALRITTAIMSLVLNAGVSFRAGHFFAAFLHAFLPVLLIVLTEYGQDALLQFAALRQKQEPRDGTGLVVPHQPAEPVLPVPATPASSPAAWGGSRRTPPSAPGPVAPVWVGQLLEKSASRPGALAPDTEATRQGGSSHDDELATPLATPAPPAPAPVVASSPGVASPPRQPTPVTSHQLPVTKRQPVASRQPASASPPGASRQRQPASRQSPAGEPGDLVNLARPLVSQGLGRQAIAKQLGISEHQARQAIDQVKSKKPSLHAVGGAR
jgi:hypothetical protein